MEVGDTIKCSDSDDLIDTMHRLAKSGIDTDFDYSKKNEYRLVVIKVEAENDRGQD